MNDLELIRSVYDEAPDRDASDRAARVALDALRDQMDSPTPVRPARRRARRLAVAVAGASALAVAGAVLLDGSDSTLTPGPQTAAAYLSQAARSAAQSDEPWRLRPGQYWYSASKMVNTGAAANCDGPVKQDLPHGGFTVRGDCGTIAVESWDAIDGSGRQRQVGPAGPDGKAYEEDFATDPHPQGADRPYVDFPELKIPYREVAGLSGDDLAERVRQDAGREAVDGRTTTGNLFLFVGRLLADKSLSPDQRAGLYRMMARQPGIQSLGEVTDPEGRAGVAVGRGEEGREEMIVFDPQTSHVLAVGTGLAGRTPPGGTGQYSVFLESGIVGSTTETP